MSQTLHTVHVRVNDAATGQPTPVRLRLTGPDSEYHAPFGRLVEFSTGRNQDVGGNLVLGRKPYAYIDGACEVMLPAGPIHVEISKGAEFTPVRDEVTLTPGKLALRFAIKRWTDLRAERWYSGDVRAHFLTPHGALLEAMAEDLAVVNLLAMETRIPTPDGKTAPAIPNILAFSGQKPVLESPGHLVAVNTLNTHPILGSLGLLCSHRVVYPLSFGGPDGKDDWTMEDWCDQCHRKNGLVVWARTWHEQAEFRYGEPLADLILGKVDAFEIDFFEDSPFDVLPDWYTLLNAGLRVPLVGASGKDGNGIALGAMRTYARLAENEEFNYRNWIEAVRAGRTFATNGPLVSFTVDGRDPGATIVLPPERQTVSVRAEAKSVTPFDRLEIVVNGDAVMSATASGLPCSAAIEVEVPVAEGGWIAARCSGQQLLPHRPAAQRVFAHSSPVYLEREGQPLRADPQAVRMLTGELERLLGWVQREARCDTDAQRARLAHVFEEAIGRLRLGS